MGADLSNAKLSGANLANSDTRTATFLGATYDSQTTWPSGFDPQSEGAIEV